MKSRKQVWIAVLGLLSALAVSMAFTLRTSSVQAGKHSGSANRTAFAQPAAYLASPSLRAASDAWLLNSVGAKRVTANLNANPTLPDAEEFTLTPPDPAQKDDKTTFSVRFAEADAERLAAQIPMTLAGQSVVLRRSAEDPKVFSTRVDFDWTAFLKMQQRRKELAHRGKTIPIYKGRDFIRQEMVEFVDPAEIHLALQKHQPIQFKPDVLMGTMLTVVPDHELMIITPTVVEDTENGQGRTYDICLQQQYGRNPGNPSGAWTFQTLWMAAINTSDVHQAQLALQSFLANWQNTQPINGFMVAPRTGIGMLGGSMGLLSNWPIDDSHGMCNGAHCPSLQAPVRLNAIVNRIDLAGNPGQTLAGELRFVFGVTAGIQAGDTCSTQGPPSGSPPPFNIILEYHVPSTYTATQWANLWDSLPKDSNFGSGYVPALQSTITDTVVKSNSCLVPGTANKNTCLFHIRTNEILLTDNPGSSTAIWELREFGVNLVTGGSNTIPEIAVDQTPDNSFQFGGAPCLHPHQSPNGQPPCNAADADALADWINPNQDTIYSSKGIQPPIPQTLIIDYQNNGTYESFQGGSSLNGFQNGSQTLAGTYWNNCPSKVLDGPTCEEGFSGDHVFEARRYFSLNTCNGCHGEETSTSSLFQQVFNRLPTNSSNLSNFLLGCAPAMGSCGFGSPGTDSCTIGTQGQCPLNTPGQESVEDLVDHIYHSYGDIVARQMNMSMLAPVNEIFLPFMRPHIGVH